ncbi:hypothetical protein B7P43_G10714 [Cryptotermes secundus]|uniref:Mos1 transposase HTH domain-containing protein n=1 Tax=Cryptotermes secundus TaxID=105785 RepID=A0A2J7RGZ0_9NEOP|nr:hypothetical protein B7P43_G10714 [Cryptotermes secundus]
MTESLEQRYCIKFCQKFGDTQAETIRKIQQAFGDDAMGVTQIKEWFNRFKHGRMSADSDLRSGRPSTSRHADVIEKVRTLIMEDRRLAIREAADEVGINRDSANTVFTEDLGMRRVAAKFVPKLLSPEQQQLRREVAQDMLEYANRDSEFLKTHHDNAPAHSSHLIQGFLAKHGIPQVRQARYTPDMSPCDFWLFPRLKTPLGHTAQLHAIPKEAFQNCFQQWKDRWAKCVESQGAYLEGD